MKPVEVISCKEGDVTVHTSYSHMLDPKGLIPHPDNNNLHSQEQVDAAKSAIKASGWRERVVVSVANQKIVSGHLRVLAAIEMGMDKIPVDMQNFESRIDEVRFLTAANELARHANFDKKIFMKTQRELKKEMDKNQYKLAFMKPQDFGLKEWPKEDEESTPEAKLPIQSLLKEGDVWNLGPHKLELGTVNPDYEDTFQKFIRKWRKLQGAPAILEATGQTFDEVMDERRNQ